MDAKSIDSFQTDEQLATQAATEPWERVRDSLSLLLVTASELYGTKTLADALDPDVVKLATRMGVSTSINKITINCVTKGSPGLVASAIGRLAAILEGASRTERTIIGCRLIRTQPKTLAEVGSLLGVTRERVRQIQAKIERKIRGELGDKLQIIALTLKEHYGHMAEQCAVENRIEDLLLPDQPIANKLFRQILIAQMGFTLEDQIYIDKQADEVLSGVRANAYKFADDAGLVSAESLIAGLPNEDWWKFWPYFRKLCGFHDLYGSLGIRDSAKARVKAAILLIGRPATRKEIAAVCGLNEDRIGGHLSNLPSVVRADKERWGIREWVDDEYEGIPAEIIQRINEDGGATTTERLLREIPNKFNVSPSSVRAYMQAPKFVIREGWISIATPSSLRLRLLDDVIDGRDRDGCPYWIFVVESRFLSGYSLTGVPPEFAKALGCAPDSAQSLQIVNLPNCRELSIQWRLSSTTGASIGYLSEPLRQLNLQPGQHVRVTIKEPGAVCLSAEDGSNEKPLMSEADAVLERMMKRRRAL